MEVTWCLATGVGMPHTSHLVKALAIVNDEFLVY